MKKESIALTMCLLMIASYAPASSADETTDPMSTISDSTIWGVSYDWENFEGDMLKMTGVDVNEINNDLEEAAAYAGFDLEYDEVLSGTTQFFVESWDEPGPYTVSASGDSEWDNFTVSKRITELTLRHGSMADTGMASNWSDGDEEIDVWVSAYSDTLAVINAQYVEYVSNSEDGDLLVYGADLIMDGEFSISMGYDVEVGVTAANETVSPEISSEISLSFGIPSMESSWKVPGPIDYHFMLASPPNGQDADTLEIPGKDGTGYEYEEDDAAIWVDYDDTGFIDGTYSSMSSYSVELTAAGIPTDELDIDIDVFNVALSDSIPDNGYFFEEMPLSAGAMWALDCPPVMGTETLEVDGSEVQAQCGLTPPIPWPMAVMMGLSMSEAFENGVEQLGEAVVDEAEGLMGEFGLAPDGNDGSGSFVCDNGNEIPENWVNDGEDDCGDDSDENAIHPDSIWHCSISVNIESLPGLNVGDFEDKLAAHPGYPEWCGEYVELPLSIDDSEASNLPPLDDIYGEIRIDEGAPFECDNGNLIPEYWVNDGWDDCGDNSDETGTDPQPTWVVEARNMTHWLTGDIPESDCNGELTWRPIHSTGLCAGAVEGEHLEDSELIFADCCGWARYDWSGDYLYIASPIPEWELGGARDLLSFECDDDFSLPGYRVNDGVVDCYDGSDENDGTTGGTDDFDKYERMGEALAESDLEKTMEAFGEKLEMLLEDNFPEDPLYDPGDICATMLWDTSDYRVHGMVVVLEGRVLLGPSISGTQSHPMNLSVEFLSGQAARDAKSGTESVDEMAELAPPSKHDVEELYEILGPQFIPDLDTTDTDNDGKIDFFDTDDDNDGIWDWEDPEPNTPLAEEASGNGVPAPGAVAALSIVAAAAILASRRDD